MPRVLLLLPTTTYRTHDFLQAARRLGVDVTVGSEEPSTLEAMNPAGLVTLDFSDPDESARRAAAFAAKHPIDAVVPVDDQVTVVGAAICRVLGLPSNSIESAAAARSKHRMRELLERVAVPQPGFRLCSLDDDPRGLARVVHYPSVVKPLAMSASRGVIRANDPAEFVAAVERLAAILRSEAQPQLARRRSACDGEQPAVNCEQPAGDQAALTTDRHPARRDSEALNHFLVEDFVPGPEVALEGLLTDGRLCVLALFDKPDPLDGPFFEETIYVTPSRLPSPVQADIACCAERAARAIGLVHGPVHVELRVDQQTAISDQQSAISDSTHHSPLTTHSSPAHHSPLTTHSSPCIIEVNPRSIGGLCSRVLRFGTGLSLEELIIRHALDRSWRPPERERRPAGVMMIPIPGRGVLREVRGLAEAKAVPGIDEVTISAHAGQKLLPLPEGSVYLGFIFARADSPEAVEAALRASHAKLECVIEPC